MNRFETFTTNIVQIHSCIQRIEAALTKPMGLKGSHVIILFEISLHPKGMSSQELVHACCIDKAAVSRAIGQLEKKQMITQEQDSSKTYRKRYFLTEQGKIVAAKLTEETKKAVSYASKDINDFQLKQFYVALLSISNNLQTYTEEKLYDETQ